MPVCQLFRPANPKYLYDDHDYLKYHAEDAFLMENHITQIEMDQVLEIEEKTRAETSRNAWKRERSMRLTSSRFGEVCRATIRRDKRKLAASLTSQQSFKSLATSWGIKHEAVAVKAFEKVTCCILLSCVILSSSLPTQPCIVQDYCEDTIMFFIRYRRLAFQSVVLAWCVRKRCHMLLLPQMAWLVMWQLWK